MATPFAPLKIQIAYLNSPTPITTSYTQKVSRYLVRNWNQCKVGLFLPNLVAMATALAPLKIQIAYVNSPNPVTLLFTRKILDILYRTKISAILAHFCPNLVAMVTPFAPLKIQIAYLKSSTPITLPYTQKVYRYLVQNWNNCNFGLFLPKFGCYGNSLCSLEN